MTANVTTTTTTTKLGLEPPPPSKAAQIKKRVQQQKSATSTQKPGLAVQLLTAGSAACVADLVTFPLDTAKVRLQVRNDEFINGGELEIGDCFLTDSIPIHRFMTFPY